MQTINNYDKSVFNGDIGKIKKINLDSEELIVVYEDFNIQNGKLVPENREVMYDFSEVKELTLAYSTTIHKAQGSEYPYVIVPVSPLLINTSRSILYTSITRAKSSFIFVGSVESLRKGIEKIDSSKRNTKLRDRIG